MLYRDISRILAYILMGFCAVLLVPIVLALFYQDHAVLYFAETLIISLIVTAIFYYFGRTSTGNVYRREGLATVVFLWFFMPVLCALPFYLSGVLKNPFMAYFEAVSGLTTTGATTFQAKHFDASGKEVPIVKTIPGVLNTTYSYYGTLAPIRDPHTGAIVAGGFEAVSKAILFWRSFIQWLGGGGIIVLFLAILPALGAGGKVLFQTEVPGPIKESLRPRVRETAIQLWKIYLVLTVLILALIMLTNAQLSWFDSITLTFAALSTGGFSIHENSIGFYQSDGTLWAIIFAMLLGSINFSIYYHIWKGKLFKIFKQELFLYGSIILAAVALGTYALLGTPERALIGELTIYDFGNAIRDSAFQIVSAISTTGFSTTNYDGWPYLVQVIMLIIMFLGGMSGSTAGGIKIMRLYMLFRIVQFKVESLFRPNTVRRLKVDGREVDQGSMILVLTFFLMIIAVSVAGTFFYVLDGLDPETALGAVACMINNTGLAFRMAGPVDSFAFMSNISLVLSSLLMIMGRLEFFAIFAVFVPAFWKQNQ